ncbi:hypothetical protein DY000_02013016 [Brassica cretica]|uniref:Uncharacterized protein n=1 Tax=Brassica cretica TaxID=69181 RepID=A0ABQ7D0W4_BRACR|nr:hypothetical protein DY000_02013016 [Brassica cretica]
MVRRDEEYFARFTRESLDRIGKLVRSLKWAWGSLHGDEFWEKRDEFISTIVPSFYSCQCVPVLERDWILWFIENSKGDKMCNRCFWIKEVGLFFLGYGSGSYCFREIGSCGSLKTVRVIKCVTAVSGSKSWGSSSVSLNR